MNHNRAEIANPKRKKRKTSATTKTRHAHESFKKGIFSLPPPLER
jgi:hypothetical protein